MRRLVPVLVVVAIVVGVVLFTLHRNQIPAEPPSDSTTNSQPAVQPTNAVTTKPATNSTEEAQEPTEAPEPNIANEPVTEANWDEKLNDLLGNDKIDEDAKADKIADMMPNLSAHAQEELAGHLINLVRDEEYGKAAAILKNEKTPPEAGKILLDDLFNRDHSLMLPLILDVAKNQNHPLKGDAKEMLEMVLQEDHGDNWEDWSKAVDKVIKGEGQ